jgi:hypothetical protein
MWDEIEKNGSIMFEVVAPSKTSAGPSAITLKRKHYAVMKVDPRLAETIESPQPTTSGPLELAALARQHGVEVARPIAQPRRTSGTAESITMTIGNGNIGTLSVTQPTSTTAPTDTTSTGHGQIATIARAEQQFGPTGIIEIIQQAFAEKPEEAVITSQSGPLATVENEVGCVVPAAPSLTGCVVPAAPSLTGCVVPATPSVNQPGNEDAEMGEEPTASSTTRTFNVSDTMAHRGNRSSSDDDWEAKLNYEEDTD